MKVAHALLIGLALFGHTAMAYDEDDEGGYGGGGDEGGYGGGGGEDEDAPPPPSGDVQELLSVEDFDNFLDDTDASVIGAFLAKEMTDPAAVTPEGWDEDEDGAWEAPTVENPALVEFKTISSAVYGYRYAFTTAPAVLEKLKSKKGGLYLFRSPKFVSTEHGDRPRERFPSEKLSESAVSNWLSAKAQPLVGMFTSSTKDRYKSAVLVIFLNLDFDKNSKSINYVLKRARKAAVGLKGKLAIAVASVSDLSYELADYGLTSTKPNTEILMGIKSGSDHYGSSATAFSAATLSAFADSFLAGELVPHVKPEPDYSSDTSSGDDDAPDDVEDDDGAGDEGDDKEEM